MSDILSAEDLDADFDIIAAFPGCVGADKAARRIRDSHKALRARLAEVEAEREGAANLYNWALEAKGAAEARLAEAIELLRAMLGEWDEGAVPVGPDAVWYAAGAARVWLEEQDA